MNLTDATFENRIQTDTPTVVVFWQRNCAPCKAVIPVLIEAARERSDVQFVLMNSEDNPKTKAKYNVTACPTLTLFRNGHALGRWMGAAPKEKLLAWIDRTNG